MKSKRNTRHDKSSRRPTRKKRMRRQRLARETSMAIAMLMLMLAIAGAFIYIDNYTASVQTVKQPVSAVGQVTLEVIAPQNNTTTQPQSLPAQQRGEQ